MGVIYVKKRSGEVEPYNSTKLEGALNSAGATPSVVQDVMTQVEAKLYDGISTKEIYKLAFTILEKIQKPTALRFNLKNALFKLGPDGHNFEKLIAELFKHTGYKSTLNPVIKGASGVSHELDVLLERDNEKKLVECKFHAQLGYKCHMQTALYVQARFEDVNERGEYEKILLATSSKFSQDVIKYAKYKRIELLGWDYPRKNLQTLIEGNNLYPITVFKLSNREKTKFLSNRFVFARQLLEKKPELLGKNLKISKTRIEELQNIAKELILP